MDFQFAEDFKKLTIQCPPNNYKPQNILVYRWVFDTITDPENFKPVFYKNPTRARKFPEDAQCKSLALSLFASEYQARDRFYALKDTNGAKIYKTLGTMIAQLNMNEQDGVNSEPDRTGHLSHHPVINHDYENRFSIISTL